MLLFLASVLEQLDLALEHISKGDIHNARFGVMLTDNAVELVLHQIAKDRASKLKMYSYRREEYPHQAMLNKALGRAFDAKVKSEIRQGIGYDSDAEILVAGSNKSIPVPRNIIELLDRVYFAFPRSPFDHQVERSPKDWHIKMWKFSRKIFPKSKMPSVIYFKSKPPMTSKKSRRAGAKK